MGRNIEIVLERSRRGSAATRNHSVPPGTGLAHYLLELLRNLRQLAAADACCEGMAGLFLKHTLQVPLRVTGALRHFPATGAIQVILDPRQNTMDSDGVIITSGHHLTSSYFVQDLLEQLLKHGDFVRRQIFR